MAVGDNDNCMIGVRPAIAIHKTNRTIVVNLRPTCSCRTANRKWT